MPGTSHIEVASHPSQHFFWRNSKFQWWKIYYEENFKKYVSRSDRSTYVIQTLQDGSDVNARHGTTGDNAIADTQSNTHSRFVCTDTKLVDVVIFFPLISNVPWRAISPDAEYSYMQKIVNFSVSAPNSNLLRLAIKITPKDQTTTVFFIFLTGRFLVLGPARQKSHLGGVQKLQLPDVLDCWPSGSRTQTREVTRHRNPCHRGWLAPLTPRCYFWNSSVQSSPKGHTRIDSPSVLHLQACRMGV